jgi:hypothetical protein
MRSYIGLIILFLALISAHQATANVWNDWQTVEEAKPFKVIQYLDLEKQQHLVVLDAGASDGIVNGSTFKTYRISAQKGSTQSDALWVTTGELKAVDVQAKFTVAEVTGEAGNMAKAFFPQFPGVMAGDVAVSQRVALVRRQVLTPERTISYYDIFSDPKAGPTNFEISAKGREELIAAASEFAKARLSLLMIEGYTDHRGPTNVNQVESYQRALTVREFLIHELGFDPKRVIAVGYGESEQVDATMAPGYVESNRRIVFKAIPVGD